MKILKKIDRYLTKGITKTQKLILTRNEKKLIGDLSIYKEKYKLDTTFSIYRYNKNITSIPFEGNENIEELKKLIKIVSKI